MVSVLFRRSSRYVVCLATAKIRGIASTRAILAAHNFSMPAMSPTMTEGGIVEWKFKEGETFSAGDVLLEIETDKAQIDVEAQDDGVMAKIYNQAGEKGIPVGKTIAVIMDPSDDLSTVEIPPQEPSQEATQAPPKDSPKESPKEPSLKKTPNDKSKLVTRSGLTSTANPKQTLLPSVLTLIKEKGISSQEAIANIPASGPNGRILKGDVLAYVGTVSRDSVDSISQSIKKLQKLDLTNIKLRPSTTSTPVKKPQDLESKQTSAAAAAAISTTPAPVVLDGVFSLSDINLLKTTVDSTLSCSLSVENLVAKAVKLAQKDIPRLSRPKRSVLNDPLFDELVAQPNTKPFDYKLVFPKTRATSRSADIYDVLASAKKPVSRPVKSAPLDTGSLLNVTVMVNPKSAAGHKKAQIFLDRLGYYLAEGKGDLVL
jgi:hypothetical protein